MQPVVYKGIVKNAGKERSPLEQELQKIAIRLPSKDPSTRPGIGQCWQEATAGSAVESPEMRAYTVE